MKPVFYAAIFALILCYRINSAQQYVELSGSLPELLKADKPYLVVGDVFVPPGSSVTIEAGTVFLFESFTGLHVQGTAYVKGDLDKPVIFTSKNDKQWNPDATVEAAPFDWNGIDLYETCVGTNFNQCIIRFSVYGIRSQTEHFKIVNSIFSNNGKADMTINGERQNITADSAFSYGVSSVTKSIPLPEPQQLAKEPPEKNIEPIAVVEKNITKQKTRIGVQVLRYTSLAIGVGSGAAATWYYLKRFDKAQQKLEDLSDLDKQEKWLNSSKDWEAAKKDRDQKLGLCISGASGAFLGIGFFALSFAF